MSKIKLGYEIGSGKEVFISPSHLIVTGITQQSGKTTTLEALIQRSSLKAIVFKTKPGEKSFTSGTVVAPFFRDRSDYEFVRSLIEAYSKEKLMIEKGTLMNICKGSKSLVEIKVRVDEAIAAGKLRGIKEEIYTRLQHYLENLIPQIQYANFSSTLNTVEGVNIMDLERFTDEAQSLIIRSVADEVLKNSRDTIIVIPEAWKFIPQRYNNPCKQAVESYIRQGAANRNFIWIDSQDMSGVDKIPLKQVSTWILGYQAERNEVQHTLDQISLPKKQKPGEEDIMQLSIGQFMLSSREQVVKVYVQPAWLSDEQGWKIATGKMDLSEAVLSKPLPSFNIPAPLPKASPDQNGYATKKELSALRIDFFNKIEQVFTDVQNVVQNLRPVESFTSIDEDDIIAKVLQKMPQKQIGSIQPAIDEEKLVRKILSQIPRINGGAAYEIKPLVKIQKDFLNAAKAQIISEAQNLSATGKKILKFVEAQQKGCNQSFIIEKCLYKSATSGGTRSAISKECTDIVSAGLLRKDKNSVMYPNLKERIIELMGIHEATAQEIEDTYDHIVMEIISI